MIIREATMYQVVCDECGDIAYDMDAEYSTWLSADDANERWIDADGVAVGGRHACYSPECGIAVLSTHPDLVARGATIDAGRWWVVFDRELSEYAVFYALFYAAVGQYRPVPAQSGRSLATVMDEVRVW